MSKEHQTSVRSSGEVLAGLRRTHIELMQLLNEAGSKRSWDVSPSESLLQRIRSFTTEVQASGAQLEFAADRFAAQSILDYWCGELLSHSGGSRSAPDFIQLNPFDPTFATELASDECPYVGLRPFDLEEGPLFFGRDASIGGLLECLRQRPITILHGPASSGKTSLVVAGLLSRLAWGETNAPVLVSLSATRTQGPLAPYAREGRYEIDFAQIGRPLERGEEDASDERDLSLPFRLLVVDDFEDLFISRDESDRLAFARALRALPEDARSVVIVSDSYVEVAEELLALPADGSARYRIPDMTPRELRQAIVKPAGMAGVRVEDALADRLVREVRGDPTALPLLQLTLARLWKTRKSNVLTLGALTPADEPRNILAAYATEFFRALESNAERGRLEELLVCFVRLKGRRVERAELSLIDLEQRLLGSHIESDLKRLVAAGILLRIGNAPHPHVRYTVAHESLFHEWSVFAKALDARRDEFDTIRRIEALAYIWQRRQRPQALLANRPDFMDGLKRRELSSLARAYLVASRRKWVLQVTGFASVVLTLAAAVILLMTNRGSASTASLEEDVYAKAQVTDLSENLKRLEANILESTRNGEEITEASVVDPGLPPVNASGPSCDGAIWLGGKGLQNLAQPPALADIEAGVPLQISRSLVLRQDAPTASYEPTSRRGTVFNGTRVSAAGSPIPYVRGGGVQYWVRVQAPAASCVVVYIQAPPESTTAARIRDELRQRGYDAPGVDKTASAKGLNEVRFFYETERPFAKRAAEDVAEVLGELGLANGPPDLRFLNLRSDPPPNKGIVELWIDVP